jgi:hypothetical protein
MFKTIYISVFLIGRNFAAELKKMVIASSQRTNSTKTIRNINQ